MPGGAYTSVRGAALASLVHETHSTFLAGPRATTYDPHLPNSLRLVALESFAKKTKRDKLRVLGDVVDADIDLPIERDASEIFVHASTAGAYIDDLVCELVCQELYKDAAVRVEDASRLAGR